MGVQGLWQALDKGGAVEVLDGASAEDHEAIREELEGSVVAVDLSAWLMQAQTQPELVHQLGSDFACALKVVFDRTIHWLRYGCLPLFVVEGTTPPAKLAKLRQRCVAVYGPGAAQWRVGNTGGSHFSSLGRKVTELLDLMGVPWIQAEGEGEATCAALNMCGWAQGCHTADVDALLFGAVTVYRTLSLHTAQPKNTKMVRCRRTAIQRALELTSGGTQALVAVAQLAGGDYDVAGAEGVGEGKALGAVRCLLKGQQDDSDIVEALQAALARGPDPALDALTKCTGCKCCGHEGGRKASIKTHGRTGCAECGTDTDCIPSDRPCQCAFHSTSDDRLLNRVLRRALATPGFLENCKVAARTYASEARRAIEAVQKSHGLAVPGTPNVFTWRTRPDVRGITALMGRYIPSWQYQQVRLKLLPLLLEWDIRCGPQPGSNSGVQFRPIAIKKVSGARGNKPQQQLAGGEDEGEAAALPTEGWRYVLEVERRQPVPPNAAGAAGGKAGSSGPSGSAAAGAANAAAAARLAEALAAMAAAEEEEEAAIDASWLNGTARSRPKAEGGDDSDGDGLAGVSGATAGGSEFGARGSQQLDLEGARSGGGAQSQVPPGTPLSQRAPTTPQTQRTPIGAKTGSGKGRKEAGSLPFGEHRSVRCTLIHELWPHLVRDWQLRAVQGSAKKAPRRAAASGKAGSGVGASKSGKPRKSKKQQQLEQVDERQPTLKDFFALKKTVPAAAAGATAGRAAKDEGPTAPRSQAGRGLGGYGLGGYGLPASGLGFAAPASGNQDGGGALFDHDNGAAAKPAALPRLPPHQQQRAPSATGPARRGGGASSGAARGTEARGGGNSRPQGPMDRFLLRPAAGQIMSDHSNGGDGGSEGGSEEEDTRQGAVPRRGASVATHKYWQQQQDEQEQEEQAPRRRMARGSGSQPIEVLSGNDDDAAEDNRMASEQRGRELAAVRARATSGSNSSGGAAAARALAFVGAVADEECEGSDGDAESPEAPLPLWARLARSNRTVVAAAAPTGASGLAPTSSPLRTQQQQQQQQQQQHDPVVAPRSGRRQVAAELPDEGSPAKKACTPDAKRRVATGVGMVPAATPPSPPLTGGGTDWMARRYAELLRDLEDNGPDPGGSTGSGSEGEEEDSPQPLRSRRRQLFRGPMRTGPQNDGNGTDGANPVGDAEEVIDLTQS